jgi:cell division initiation protein
MELTVEVLRDAEFREGWRGYNPADVDEFIDRISVGVQELQDRIHALNIRAERAESRLGGENDETVKRTLVLAQRAADLVVSEAKSVAERIVQDAHREAERTIADANATAAMRQEQSDQEIVRRAAESRTAAEAEHDLLITQHRLTLSDAEQESRLATARAHELHTQAMALRDRFRAALTDQLVRLDRLVEAVEPQSTSSTGVAASLDTPYPPHPGSEEESEAPGGRYMAPVAPVTAVTYEGSGGSEPVGRYAASSSGDSALVVGSEFSLSPSSADGNDGVGLHDLRESNDLHDLHDLPTFAPGSGRHSAGPMAQPEGFGS